MEKKPNKLVAKKEVYVIIKRKSVDYHGCYDEIVNIFNKKEDADKILENLLQENIEHDIEYFIFTYPLI